MLIMYTRSVLDYMWLAGCLKGLGIIWGESGLYGMVFSVTGLGPGMFDIKTWKVYKVYKLNNFWTVHLFAWCLSLACKLLFDNNALCTPITL